MEITSLLASLVLLASAALALPRDVQPSAEEVRVQDPSSDESEEPGGSEQDPPAPEPDWAAERALLDEAQAALDRSDYPEARERAARAIDALLASPSSERVESWALMLDRAGRAAWQAQDAGSARRAWEHVLQVRSRTLSSDHPELQATRGNLAATMSHLGDLHGARELEEQVLDALSRTLPADHPDLQNARQNLAVTLYFLGDLHSARALFEQVHAVRTRTLPADHPALQQARGNLAAVLADLGDLASAQVLEGQLLEVFSRTLPADHPDLQLAHQNVAATMYSLGDLHGARALLEQVIEVRTRTLPADDPDLQSALQNLAGVLAELGDLAGARALFEAVLEVHARTLPADHPELQKARGNLAGVLEMSGDLRAARALEEGVLEVFSRTLSADHPDLQNARGNLAGTLKGLGDLQGARALLEEVLEVFSRTLSADDPDLQRARGNLAGVLADLGDLVGAAALYEQVLEVRTRTLPADHANLQAARLNLAWTLALLTAREGLRGRARGASGEPDADREGGWPRALALVSEAARDSRKAVRQALWTASVREAEERVARGAERPLGNALSFAAGLERFERNEELLAEAFELSEASRGAALAGATLARAEIEPKVRERLREEIRAAGEELTRLAQGGGAREEYHHARARREAAERELLLLARGQAREGLGALEVDTASLAEVLGPDRALVGLRRYERWWLEETGSADDCEHAQFEEFSLPSLGAFVLRSVQGEPRLAFVDLGAVSELELLVGAWREAIRATPERGLGLTSKDEDPALAIGRRLRGAVWDPLVAHLEGAERVVLALDDVLHLVPLDALPLETEGELVGDRWRIETRVALWELLDPPRPASERVALVSLGGASFNSEPKALAAEVLATLEPEKVDGVEIQGTQSVALLRGGAWARGFAPLSYTRTEARGLAELFEETFEGRFDDEVPALVLDRARASRAALVEAAPRARFLHVATHGWFAPESVRSWADAQEPQNEGIAQRLSGEDTVRGMSPMLLCGLALAGANLPADALGRVPGLVTAEELSTLDLTGCELAVLSACDTNVGERRAGQGVASLQKALHMAGARSVITSLWKVPDEATSELMLDFYRRLWVENKPKHQALWEAKLRLRNAKDERGEPLYTVRDWAAWVLTGEPD